MNNIKSFVKTKGKIITYNYIKYITITIIFITKTRYVNPTI